MSDQNSTIQQMIINGLLVDQANTIDNQNQYRIDGVVQQSKSRVEISAAKDKAEAAKKDADISEGRLKTVQKELAQVKDRLLQVEMSFDLFRQATSEVLQEVALEQGVTSSQQWLAKLQKIFEEKSEQQIILDEQKAREPKQMNSSELKSYQSLHLFKINSALTEPDKIKRYEDYQIRFEYWNKRGLYSDFVLPEKK